MNINEIYNYIDYTLLKPTATNNDIWNLCKEAEEKGCASVCVPSCYVSFVLDFFPMVNICTVVGFPLGMMNTDSKCYETKTAIEDGADEIDMVINVGALKDKDYDFVLADIKAVRESSKGKILKVIIECCLLTNDEIVKACELSKEAGADFVKTSTGFNSGGATEEDVALMRQTVGDHISVKASGGIRDYEQCMKMIEAGADRIGASASVKIMEVYNNEH
jgi:deoxyribose-phosphate aldolase